MVAVATSGAAERGPAWLLLPASGRDDVAPRLAEACAAHGAVIVARPPPKCVAPRELAAAHAASIVAAGHARAFVVGLSFGGQLAQALLQFEPARVAGLLLIASGAPDRARGLALRRRSWAWRWLPLSRRLPRARLMASDLEGATEPGAFAATRVPVAIVELGADMVIAPSEAARVRSLFPQATRTVVPHLGHDALHSWPDPLHAAAVAAIAALLSAPAPAGSR